MAKKGTFDNNVAVFLQYIWIYTYIYLFIGYIYTIGRLKSLSTLQIWLNIIEGENT